MSKFSRLRTILPWLWKASKEYRLQATLNTLLGILLVVADLLFVWSTKLVIDAATLPSATVSLTNSFIILAIVMLSQIGLGIAIRWMRATLGVQATNKMHRIFFSQLLSTNWLSLKKFHTGDITNRLQRDAVEITQFITEGLPNFITTIVKFSGAFFLLYYMDKQLALVVLIILPLFILISRLYIKRLRKLTHEVRTTESAIQSYLQESLQHVLVIKTLLNLQQAIDKLSLHQQQLEKQVVNKTIYTTLTTTLLNLGFATGYFITFCWGTISLYQGIITYGSLLAFIQLVAQIQGPIRSLTGFIPLFINVTTSTERLMELQNLPKERGKKLPLKTPIGIRIQNLSFAYNEQAKELFSNLNLDIKPESRVAIIGETGSGKTTFVRLLLALLKEKDGSIQLYNQDGVYPLNETTRINFAYLPQGNTLLSGSVRDNLLMANPNATDEELTQVLKAACADFVLQHPSGLDAYCSEQGGGFSEGQAQRICIARTLLRKAPIMIFDEATSALDAETEQKVIQNISHQNELQTIIFITHRPAILELCDEVINMETMIQQNKAYTTHP